MIGRLLYDSKLIYDDQLSALREASGTHGTAGAGEIDYALLLDGLKAEREQGITIDVAYRYFSTPRRKFIIADCPGHEQYTRNMATGASTADLAIILVDARHGVVAQTRRHAMIVRLLGIRHVVVAVNKMDLVDYSEAVFNKIKAEFQDPGSLFIPVSAKCGANVTARSRDVMPWYDGPSLLEHLETVDVAASRNLSDFRFPVQHVIRPDLDFRGFAGTVASGVVRVGDEVTALPSGKSSRVKRIVTADGDLPLAFPPQAVTLTLEDEIDISSGDMLVPSANLPTVASAFRANLVWMDTAPLVPGKEYLFRHGSAWLKAFVRDGAKILFAPSGGAPLALNTIAEVVVETTRPLAFDPYAKNRATGRFILVDPVTNQTSGAGMILEGCERQTTPEAKVAHPLLPVFVDLAAAPCLVIGNGAEAKRKVDELRRYSAEVAVAETFEESDLDGKTLVVAATDDNALNARIAALCKARNILVNATSDAAAGTFFFGAERDGMAR